MLWLLQRLPLVWTGQLVLKNDVAAVRMHYVSGNQDLVRASLPPEALTQDGSGTTLSQLRISQRMRLDPSQLDQVSKRMEVLDLFLYVILTSPVITQCASLPDVLRVVVSTVCLSVCLSVVLSVFKRKAEKLLNRNCYKLVGMRRGTSEK